MNHDKINEVYVEVDDFCQKFQKSILEAKKLALESKKKAINRASKMSDSEIITIMIGFHFETHRCFKLQVIKENFSHLFAYSGQRGPLIPERRGPVSGGDFL